MIINDRAVMEPQFIRMAELTLGKATNKQEKDVLSKEKATKTTR